MLRAISQIVSTRFYVPPGMLRRIIVERDPVVTSGGGILRFEGFSACCSAYARLDVSPEGYQGEIVGEGTTNVDFNADTRAALAAVRDGEALKVSVGKEELKIEHGESSVVERKVDLPERWIKGFVEVQAYQSRMEKRFTVGRVEALIFLRSLPRNVNNSADYYLVSTGRGNEAGLRLGARKIKDGVRIAGMKRLNVLADLAPFLEELSVYATADGEASEWRLDCGGVSFCLTITADVSRGFSGEGQVLSALVGAEALNLGRVHANLKWQSCIDASEFSVLCSMEPHSVNRALALLGSQGMVGYDLNFGGFFHRELPFRLEEAESIHPRLKGARTLIDQGAVKILSRDNGLVSAQVQGSGVIHMVKVGDREFCTCPWHSKYQGSRGQCKHILSVLMLEQNESRS